MNDYNNSYKVHEFVAHSTRVNCLTFGPLSCQVLATGGEDCKVNIWRVDNIANIWSLSQNKSPIESLCFDPEEQYIVSGSLSGSMKIFDLNEGKLARNLTGHKINVSCLHYHPYGEFLVSGSVDNTMKAWDTRSKSCIQTYTGHEKELTCVKFSPDGRWVASSATDGLLMLWDLIAGLQKNISLMCDYSINCVSNVNHYCAGKLLHQFRMPNSYVTSFEFNPSEFLLAAAISNRTVKFWDMETFESIGCTSADSSSIRSVSFNGQGTSLCSTNNDFLRIWSWEPAQLISSINMGMGWDKVKEIKVAPNTDQLVAGSCNANYVTVWGVDLEKLADEKASGNSNMSNVQPPQSASAKGSNSSDDTSSLSATKQQQKKGSNFVRVNNNGSSDLDPILEASIAESKGDINSAKANAAPPEVMWESGANAYDLATSMGESFLKRLRDQGGQQAEVLEGPLQNLLPGPSAARYDRISKEPQVPSSASKADRREPPRKPISVVSDRNIASQRGVRTASNQSNQNLSAVPSMEGLSVVGTRHSKRSGSGGNYAEEASAVIPSNAPKDHYVYDPDYASLQVEHRPQLVPPPVANTKSTSEPPDRGRKAVMALDAVANTNSSNSNNSNSNNYNNNVSESSSNINEAESISKLMYQSDSIVSILNQRLANLRMLRQHWERGNIDFITEYLTSIEASSNHDTIQLGVIADFMSAVDLKSCNNITLNNCPYLLSMLELFVSINFPRLVLVSLQWVISLHESFGTLIRQTRCVVLSNGVDLSREERLNKCNACHNVFCRIKLKLDSLRNYYRKNIGVRDAMDRLANILTDDY